VNALNRSLILLALAAACACGATVRVADAQALRRALRAPSPGTLIAIEPGEYPEGGHAGGLAGTAEKPIVIAGADPEHPPVIRGKYVCMQLSRAAHVVLRDLVFQGASGNGLNIDDGGTLDKPSHHIVLERVTVRDIGPRGNADGIKLSGVDDLLIRRCTIERWGSGGSGIDMVGCHRALVTECTFRHGDRKGANAVQTKGASSGVVVYRCRFRAAGQRAVNMGGSTARSVFRPPGATYEARQIAVIGNTFVGSLAPVAFVGCDGGLASFNTIVHPRMWVLRILQESAGPHFTPCRNGIFRRNVVVWRAELKSTVNIGPHTAPATFRFEDNWWYCGEAPARSRPKLPAAERGAIVGRNPDVRIDGPRVTAANARTHGAHAPEAAAEFARIGPSLAPWACQQARRLSQQPGK